MIVEIIKYILVFSPLIICLYAIEKGLTDKLTNKFTLVK